MFNQNILSSIRNKLEFNLVRKYITNSISVGWGLIHIRNVDYIIVDYIIIMLII